MLTKFDGMHMRNQTTLEKRFCASWFDQNIGGKEYWTQKRISGGGRHAISDLLDATASIPFV